MGYFQFQNTFLYYHILSNVIKMYSTRFSKTDQHDTNVVTSLENP